MRKEVQVICILVLALLMMFPSVAMAADVQLEVSENAQIIPKNIPFEGPKFLTTLEAFLRKKLLFSIIMSTGYTAHLMIRKRR